MESVLRFRRLSIAEKVIAVAGEAGRWRADDELGENDRGQVLR